jgi:predicted nucleic acid-binding protein
MARTVDNLAEDLDFVELTAEEVRRALKQAKRRGVRGGLVHDFMHAVAAEKSGAKELLTLDKQDFEQRAAAQQVA